MYTLCTLRADKFTAYAFFVAGNPLRHTFFIYFHAMCPHQTFQFVGKFAVDTRDQMIRYFNDRNFRSQITEYGCCLQTGHTTAKHDQAMIFITSGCHQCFTGHNSRQIRSRYVQSSFLRTCCDQYLIAKIKAAASVFKCDTHLLS